MGGRAGGRGEIQPLLLFAFPVVCHRSPHGGHGSIPPHPLFVRLVVLLCLSYWCLSVFMFCVVTAFHVILSLSLSLPPPCVCFTVIRASTRCNPCPPLCLLCVGTFLLAMCGCSTACRVLAPHFLSVAGTLPNGTQGPPCPLPLPPPPLLLAAGHTIVAGQPAAAAILTVTVAVSVA